MNKKAIPYFQMAFVVSFFSGLYFRNTMFVLLTGVSFVLYLYTNRWKL